MIRARAGCTASAIGGYQKTWEHEHVPYTGSKRSAGGLSGWVEWGKPQMSLPSCQSCKPQAACGTARQLAAALQCNIDTTERDGVSPTSGGRLIAQVCTWNSYQAGIPDGGTSTHLLLFAHTVVANCSIAVGPVC